MYERHGFWQLSQQEGEPVDTYLTRLRLKVDYCEYDKDGWPAAVRTEILCDKFVFGLTDDVLKERLLRETGELTLERAVSFALHSESSKLQVKEMSTSTTAANCDEIRRPLPQHSKFASKVFSCRQCGRTHRPKECPAYGQECAKCHKLHHVARVCRSRWNHTDNQHTDNFVPKSQVPQSKKVFTLEDPELHASDSDSNLLIDPIRIDGLMKPSAWLSTFCTPLGNITLKLDTGAEANILPIATYNNFSITVKGLKHIVEFFVLNVDSQPILGLKDCEQMSLIKRIDAVVTGQLTKQSIKSTYKNIFTGLGKVSHHFM